MNAAARTYDWHETLLDAIDQFGGDTPSPSLEHAILDVFREHPAAVVAAIRTIAGRHRAGYVKSPWGALSKELDRLRTNPEIVVTDTRERDKTLRAAEQWIRTVGVHYATEHELLTHLFGLDDQTAPLDYLEQLDRDTRDADGRPLYGPLLLAAIERTRVEGPQPIPGSPDAPLRHQRTTKVRDRMLAVWREARADQPYEELPL